MGLTHRVTAAVLCCSPVFAVSQIAAPLRPYSTCRFEDGLQIVEKAPLPAGAQGRTVQTISGSRNVAILRGARFVFSYPNTDPFARATVEQLPASSGTKGKSDLIAAFDKLLASDNSVQRNYSLKPTINGFEAYGLDRTQLEGRVLGIYLLIDDASLTVTSIDFLSQPGQQKFTSLEEYAKLRDQFLTAYTACVRAAPAKPQVASAKSTQPPKPTKKLPAKKKQH